MKKLYALLLVGLLSKGITSQAQKFELEVKSDYKNKVVPVVHRKASEKINDNLFLMFKEIDKKKAAIVGYDANLNQKFSIPLEHGQYTDPLFKYHAESNQIFVVESYGRPNAYTKKGHGFKASVYDVEGKLVKQKEVALDLPLLHPTLSSSHRVGFSENGKYFYTLEQYPKKGKDALVALYDINLEELYKKEFKTGTNEEIETSALADDGGLVLVVSNSKDKDRVKFTKLSTAGKEAAQVAVKHQTAEKESFGHYKLKLAGERAIVTTEKNLNRSELVAIHVYDIDFTAKNAKLYKSKEFNKEYVAQLYSKVNDKDVLNGGKTFSKKFDRPKTIKLMWVSEILIDGSSIYLVSEAINNTSSTTTTTSTIPGTNHTRTTTKSTPLQYAEDILITGFEAGENKWNSIIGRNLVLRDLPGADMMKALVSQNKNEIYIITSEAPKGEAKDMSSYTRVVNKATGDISSPKRISENSYMTFTNFACWLAPDKVVLLRSNQIKFGKGYSLNKVALN
ncbi:hypothetical protein [Rufibacter ruber]|uniref:hypothetical protein n=1 Tax=Rufibacter ruber TaxID=1783499 RepID=UPI00082B6CB5|nr:hypothetical protein [Rufibacter ruber]